MKRFTFRLFLVKRILDSLIWDCMDEYDDVPYGIIDGTAHLHSELEEAGFRMKHKKTRKFPSFKL